MSVYASVTDLIDVLTGSWPPRADSLPSQERHAAGATCAVVLLAGILLPLLKEAEGLSGAEAYRVQRPRRR